MNKHRDHQPGNIILDHYVPHLGPEDREIARARLYEYVAWHLRVIMRQLREEADSLDEQVGATLDSADRPP